MALTAIAIVGATMALTAIIIVGATIALTAITIVGATKKQPCGSELHTAATVVVVAVPAITSHFRKIQTNSAEARKTAIG
jgi:hypothetical protein